MSTNTKVKKAWNPSKEIKRLPRADSMTVKRESEKAEEYAVLLKNGRTLFVWIPKSVAEKTEFVSKKLKEIEESADRLIVLEEKGKGLKVHFMDSDIYIPRSLPITEPFDGTVAVDEFAVNWILRNKFVRIDPAVVVERRQKSILVKIGKIQMFIPISRVHAVGGAEYIEKNFYNFIFGKAMEMEEDKE